MDINCNLNSLLPTNNWWEIKSVGSVHENSILISNQLIYEIGETQT